METSHVRHRFVCQAFESNPIACACQFSNIKTLYFAELIKKALFGLKTIPRTTAYVLRRKKFVDLGQNITIRGVQSVLHRLLCTGVHLQSPCGL